MTPLRLGHSKHPPRTWHSLPDWAKKAMENDPPLPWKCPECGEKHMQFDGECTGECCCDLVPNLPEGS